MELTLEQAGVGIVHHFGGGTYAKETRIPAGCELVQHVHPYDHLSVLATGSVEVEVAGRVRSLDGPACLTITAGQAHRVRAITDAVWFCIHATDDTNPDTVDQTILQPHRGD